MNEKSFQQNNIMLKLITNNFWAKVLCITIALGFWVYVTTGENKIANFPGGVNIELKNVPTGLAAITDIDKVEIKVSADKTVWKNLSASSFSASVDLANLTQGTQELDINVVSAVQGAQIVEKTPAKILVRLEPIASKKVPVVSKIEGSAGEGLVPGDVKIEPTEVEISGPESILSKVFEATAELKLNGETEEITKVVKLIALDAQGEAIKYVSFKPLDVKVVVPIVKAGSAKTVGIKVSLKGSPNGQYWVKEVKATPTEVGVTGSAGILKTVNYIRTDDINIDGIDSNKTVYVNLSLPSGVSLVDDITRVKVDILVDKISSQKEVTPGFNWLNLASNLKIESIIPSSIKVIATGTVDILAGLNSDNVKVNVDLGSFNVSGTYNIDIVRDWITGPSGVAVSSFMPSSVSVKIVNK